MKGEDYSKDDVLHICLMYQERFGGHFISDYVDNELGDLDDLLKEINEAGATIELYRIGSTYNFNTKFGFVVDSEGNTIPEIDLNFSSVDRDSDYYQEANQAVETFNADVAAYLAQRESDDTRSN